MSLNSKLFLNLKLFKNFCKREVYTGFNPPPPTYGGKYVVTMLPGLGVGPELMRCVKTTFLELGVPVDFQEIIVDKNSDEESELHYIKNAIQRNYLAITGTLGFHTTVSFDVQLRSLLGLYENVTHVQATPTVQSKYKDIDVVVVRQNTAAEFTMMEHSPAKGVVTYLKIMTVENARKVITFAFEYARAKKRKTVTAVHKANIMKMTDGMFLKTAREVAKKYPDIKLNDLIVDNCCMQLVSKPQQFDVIVTTNLYGMMISHILLGLTGGPGLIPCYNVGKDSVVFETAARTVGLDIAGKNVVNPIAMLNTSVDLIKFLGFEYHTKLLSNAIEDTILNKKIRTKDIGGNNSTEEVISNIIDHIRANKTNLLHF